MKISLFTILDTKAGRWGFDHQPLIFARSHGDAERDFGRG